MQYRNDRHGTSLSILGFGCMRFQRRRGSIDFAEAEREILSAIGQGVNYFDTAYIYPGSEELLGAVLEKNRCREQVYIATKLPHYLIRKGEDIERLFQEQLRRLRTDHVDYYLMHMLPDMTTWERLKGLGVEEWLREKQAAGIIRNVGFSYHGSTNAFQALLEAWDWDFCQIQYNYIDEHTQAGRRGLQAAAARGIPVVVMEPLRGGRLVNALPPKALKAFEGYAPRRSPAEWGLRWLWDQPEVTVVLSGMNTMEMVAENCRVASQVRPGELGEGERALLERVKGAINEKIKVGCTGCGYCMPCPKGVDIPGCFRCYNARYTEGFYTGMKEYFMCTTLRGQHSNAARCVKCGRCETRCPQGIQIRAELDNVRRTMEGPVYAVAKGVTHLLGHF